MMKNKFVILIMALTCFTGFISEAKAEVKIAAVVNESVITVSDIEDRMRLYLLGSKGEPPAEFINQLKQKTLNELIDETLQRQEADKYGLQIPDEQIDAGLEEIAKRNNSTKDAMIKQFTGMGINIKSLRDKVKAEFTWPLLVKRKWQSHISISDDEIDMTIDNLNKSNEPEYLMAEILLTVPEKNKEAEIREKAFELTKRIKEGAPFSSVALKFSQAPGAATGGDLGWMKVSLLETKIKESVVKMKVGELSEPIRSAKGWSIILLREIKNAEIVATKEEVNKTDEKSRGEIANQLGTKRLMQMAQHYMNDLRAAAFIEKRI